MDVHALGEGLRLLRATGDGYGGTRRERDHQRREATRDPHAHMGTGRGGGYRARESIHTTISPAPRLPQMA